VFRIKETNLLSVDKDFKLSFSDLEEESSGSADENVSEETISLSDIHEIIDNLNKEKTEEESDSGSEEKTQEEKEEPDLPLDIEEDIDEKIHLEYEESSFYKQEKLDYEKLFYFKNNIYQRKYESYAKEKEEKEEETPELTAKELENIIRKEQISMMLCDDSDRLETDKKEKYKHWKDTHRMWNMILIDMHNVGNTATSVHYI